MVSKEYLSFSKRERTGIITLVILLIIVAIVPKFICHPKPVAEKLPDKQLQQLAEQKHNYYPRRGYHKLDTVYVRRYVPSKYKYRKYSEPANPLPWRGGRADSETKRRDYTARPGWVRPKPIPIDINTADTAAFISLPGIGSKLANRIISFRTKLGGFNSIEQIKEVYGLRDSVFQIIQPLLICKLSP
jgi:competence protein ComEA